MKAEDVISFIKGQITQLSAPENHGSKVAASKLAIFEHLYTELRAHPEDVDISANAFTLLLACALSWKSFAKGPEAIFAEFTGGVEDACKGSASSLYALRRMPFYKQIKDGAIDHVTQRARAYEAGGALRATQELEDLKFKELLRTEAAAPAISTP